MARKLQKVPQPPIDRSRRSSERRPLILGTLVAAVGGAMLLWGFRLHKVHDGAAAAYSDYDLVSLIRTGDLERQPPAAAAGPATRPAGDPAKQPGDPSPGGLTTPDPDKPKKLCPT